MDIKVATADRHQRGKPACPLIGQDGNIFNLMSIASRTLRENGLDSEAKEMCDRIWESDDYYTALGVIGHVRIDFGYQGRQFYHSWWPRGPEELNTPEFKSELGKVVDELRRGPLKSLRDMRRFCHTHGGEIGGGICGQNYGYVIETERYRYLLRCNPVEGDYQAYLTAMDKRAQEMGMARRQSGPAMSMGGM